MDDLSRYLEYVKTHADQFVNPPGGLITILLEPEQIAEVEAFMEQRLLSAGMPQEQARSWSRVGIAYQDQYTFLLRDAVRFGDGSLGTYIRSVDPDGGAPGVIVLPIYEGNVVLVRHFRHAMRQWRIELPRGFGEKGFSNEENARRELKEEIDAEVERIISLGMAEPDGGVSAQGVALFFAELKSVGAPSEAEGISHVMLTPMPEFERLIADGDIVDGFTLSAYARVKARGLL